MGPQIGEEEKFRREEARPLAQAFGERGGIGPMLTSLVSGNTSGLVSPKAARG